MFPFIKKDTKINKKISDTNGYQSNIRPKKAYGSLTNAF